MKQEMLFGYSHGLGRLLAGRNSWQGMQSTGRLEAAFRQELLLLAALLPVALWLQVTAVEYALLALLTQGVVLWPKLRAWVAS